MSTYNGLVYRDQDGNKITVASGGVINVQTGGQIQANGTQAAHIADASEDATVTDVPEAKTAIDNLGAKMNVILLALEGVGITASA